MVVIFGSEQLTSSKMRESIRQWVMSQMVAVSLTQEGHTTSILQGGQAKCYSIVDM